MRVAFLLTAACLALAPARAEVWTLDSCINHAVSHNLTVASRSLEGENARLELDDARNRFLPTVSASADQSFNFGRGLTSDNTYANRNTQNFSLGLGMRLPLFQGLQAVRRVSYAKANLAAALERLEAEKDNVELNVTTQYLQTLYAAEVAEIAREQTRMSEIELRRRQELAAAGKIAEIDIAEAEAQLAQDQASAVSAESDHSLALLDLAQMLRLDSPADFAIAPLDTAGLPEILAASTVIGNAMELNHSLRAARASIEAADRSVSLARSGYIPTLSLSAGLSTNYYRLGGMENPAFSSQMRQNFSKYIGLSLSIPVFDAFSTRNSVRRAKVQHSMAQISYETEADRLSRAIAQAELQATNALARLKASTASEESTLKAFEAMRLKYDYGKASSTDFETARSNYVRSRLQAVQARFEYELRCRILRFYNRH